MRNLDRSLKLIKTWQIKTKELSMINMALKDLKLHTIALTSTMLTISLLSSLTIMSSMTTPSLAAFSETKVEKKLEVVALELLEVLVALEDRCLQMTQCLEIWDLEAQAEVLQASAVPLEEVVCLGCLNRLAQPQGQCNLYFIQ